MHLTQLFDIRDTPTWPIDGASRKVPLKRSMSVVSAFLLIYYADPEDFGGGCQPHPV